MIFQGIKFKICGKKAGFKVFAWLRMFYIWRRPFVEQWREENTNRHLFGSFAKCFENHILRQIWVSETNLRKKSHPPFSANNLDTWHAEVCDVLKQFSLSEEKHSSCLHFVTFFLRKPSLRSLALAPSSLACPPWEIHVVPEKLRPSQSYISFRLPIWIKASVCPISAPVFQYESPDVPIQYQLRPSNMKALTNPLLLQEF